MSSFWYLMHSETPDEIRLIDPSISVPQNYQRSHYSDELEETISRLSETAPEGHPIQVVITGTPGGGKTQLANYYVYTHRHKASIIQSISSDTVHILWSSYRSFADKLKINTNRLPEEEEQTWYSRIIDRVNAELAKNPGWILIFDNVKQLSDIINFLPPNNSQKGVTLLTTRNEEIFSREQQVNISKGLKVDDAIKLLSKVCKLPSNDDTRLLAEELGGLPLYLLAAAGAIVNSPHKYTYKTYLEHIKKLSVEQIANQHKLYIGRVGITRTQYAVIHEVIDELAKEDQEALELLKFCSYIYPTWINVELLENFVRVSNLTLSVTDIKIKLEQLISKLQKLSLIEKIPNHDRSKPDFYSIHRVIQQVGRGNISKGNSSIILNAVLSGIVHIEDVDYDMEARKDSEFWRTIMPHMLALINCIETGCINYLDCDADKYNVVKLLYYCGKFQYAHGDNTIAENYFQQALKNLGDINKSHTLQYAIILNALGINYGRLDQLKQAAKFLREALTTAEDCECESKIVAMVHDSLGEIYMREGKFDDAQQHLKKALSIGSKYWESDSWQISLFLGHLGLTQICANQDSAAKNTLKQGVAIWERRDSDDWRFAALSDTLALVYIGLRQYEDAKNILDNALSIMNKPHNRNHWQRAIVLNTIGVVYVKLAKFEQGKQYLEESLELMKQYYPPQHWRIALASYSLGWAYEKLNNSQQAAALCKDEYLNMFRSRQYRNVIVGQIFDILP